MEAIVMKTKVIAVTSVAMITLGAVAISNPAEARWRYGGWAVPGAVVGGLALGAAIASRPYYGYGYAAGPYYGGYGYAAPYAYYGGVGPNDYEYNNSYSYQPSYRYNAPYRHWTEF
jgi:hypothetical protein